MKALLEAVDNLVHHKKKVQHSKIHNLFQIKSDEGKLYIKVLDLKKI